MNLKYHFIPVGISQCNLPAKITVRSNPTVRSRLSDMNIHSLPVQMNQQVQCCFKYLIRSKIVCSIAWSAVSRAASITIRAACLSWSTTSCSIIVFGSLPEYPWKKSTWNKTDYETLFHWSKVNNGESILLYRLAFKIISISIPAEWEKWNFSLVLRKHDV